MKPKNIITLSITLALVSCVSVPTQVSLEIPAPTVTRSLSATPPSTPALTRTATSIPIETPIPTETFAPVPSERPEDDLISGTYKMDRGAAGYCALRAVLQPFLMSFQEVAVELFCLKGAPSYNSGYAPPQKILMADNIAVYSVPEEYFNDSDYFADAPCHFVFEFERDQVKVTQLGLDMDCGFGHAVYANGVYKLIDSQPPVLGCLSIWDACSALYPLPE